MRAIFIKPISILLLIISYNQLRSQNGTWTWMHGSSTANVLGNYGTIGIASPSNDPPAIYEAASFTDLQGNFWVFGGLDNNNQEQAALWKFDPLTNMWTWMKGPSTTMVAGSYGVQGIASTSNFPGSRAWGMMSWTDLQGNFWIFGGYGYDATGTLGPLADLWKYEIATNNWTWMSGPNTTGFIGNYGVMQVPASSNLPPARFEAATSWTTNNGDLYMYGGGNFLSLLNDMWRYNIATNTWTWMSGSNSGNITPNYGFQYIASSTNTPGSRNTYGKWKDGNGNLWLFGGSDNAGDYFADMWMYDVNTNYWTWINGSNQINDNGTFTQACIQGNQYPACRYENRCCWTDNCGRFWQYGGFNSGIAHLNDIWMYDPGTNQFTFIGGSTGFDVPGSYGTMLLPSSTNFPDAGAGQIGFNDNSGNLWMFGGWSATGKSNALWKFNPNTSCTSLPLIATIFPSNSNCATTTIQFNSGSTNAGGNYHWDFGDTSTLSDTANTSTGSYYYSSLGTYTVTLIETAVSGCYAGTDTAIYVLTLNSFATPFSLGSDTIFCGPINLSFDAGPASSWLWSNGSTTQQINVNTTGSYWATTTNAQGCPYTDSILVSSLVANLGADTSSCGSLVLDAGPNNGANFLWSTGDTSQIISVSTSGNYFVTISNPSASCVSTDTVSVTIHSLPTVIFSSFTDSVFCIDDANYLIPMGSPVGGNFSGLQVGNNYFIPNMGTGFSLVTYQFVDTNGCAGSSSMNFYVDICSGITSSNLNQNLFVFPIPLSNELHIQYALPSTQSIQFEIFNVNGQVVFTKTQLQESGNAEEIISLSNLANGMYLLRIICGNEIITRRIIVERE